MVTRLGVELKGVRTPIYEARDFMGQEICEVKGVSDLKVRFQALKMLYEKYLFLGMGKEFIQFIRESEEDMEGQGLVEYALILVLVAVVVIVVLALLGPAIGNVFSEVISMI